jgi:hypothetical protein
VSLRNALQQLHSEEPVQIKTGKPGELTVLVDGSTVYDYRAEGEVATAEILRRIAQAKA